MDNPTYVELQKRMARLEEEKTQLQIQAVYLERLFNSAPEAIIWHDNNDVIVNVNDEFTRMFGYTREEAIGKRINDLVAPKEYREHADMFSGMVLHGQRIEGDSKRKRKDGTVFDVSILGAPIIHDGKQMGVFAIYRDISERKKAEEEIILQKTYLERLFNIAPEAIVWHDNTDRIVNVNDEFTRMFGYSRDEAVGRPINDLLVPDGLKGEGVDFSKRVIGGERIEADTKRRRKDGSLVDVWVIGSPISRGGKQIGDYAIYRDITERKKAEEARLQAETEARTARNIQMNFLPGSDPVVPGYAIAGKSIPALNVGGDYYDFIRLDEHRIAVGLGDVSGHGLSSALVMANLQATIRSQASFDPDPARCLERANKLLYHSTDSHTFVSLFYGMLDTTRHTLAYANAGQNWPMIFSPAGAPRRLARHGLVLGVREDSAYEEEEINIEAGDVLILFSDGVIEAMNVNREQFGDERLIDTVRRAANSSAKGAIDAIISAVTAHAGKASQADDMTVVVLERK